MGSAGDRLSAYARRARPALDRLARLGDNRMLWFVCLLFAAVALAIVAQIGFDDSRLHERWNDWKIPALLALAGAVLFGVATRRIPIERTPDAEQARAVAWPRLLPVLALSLILALLSGRWFVDNTIRLPGLLVLFAGVSLALLALYLASKTPAGISFAGWKTRQIPWRWLVLLAIVAVGAFFRLESLDNNPGELTLDQISKYWDIRQVMEGKGTPVFFTANQGREGLFFYLVAMLSHFTGLSFLSLKLASALIGIATIPILYLLGKEIANTEIGLFAASFLAVSKWHIIVSRLGYRVVLVPAIVVLVMLLLARGLRRGRLLDYGLAGVSLGLGMYTYKSFPFAFPAAVCVTGLALLRGNRRALAGTAVMLLLALMVFVPMGVYAVQHWDSYAYRENLQIKLLEETYVNNDLTPVEGYLISLRQTLLMTNFAADPIEIYNPPYERFLGAFSGLLFILGLGYILARSSKDRNALVVLFFFWLIQAIAIPLFPPHEHANTLRAAASIPPIILIVAYGCSALRRAVATIMAGPMDVVEVALYRRKRETAQTGEAGLLRRFRLDLGALLAVLLGLLLAGALYAESLESYQTVFYVYPNKQRFEGYPLARRMAEEIQHWIGVAPVYLKYWPGGIDVGQVKVYLASSGIGEEWQTDNLDAPAGCQIQELTPDKPPLARNDAPALVVLLYPQDAQTGSLDTLRQYYPAHVEYSRSLLNGQPAFFVFVGFQPQLDMQ